VELAVGCRYLLVPVSVRVEDIDVQVAPQEGVKFERGTPGGYKSETELRAVIVRIKETIGTTKEVTVTLRPKNE
jgi:hypothetical protein